MQKPLPVTARPGDVDTIEHVIRTDYECVSGPAGSRDQVRQKQRDDTLYIPNAIFISSWEEKGQMKSEILTEESYWAHFGANSPDKKTVTATYETEAGHRIERFGNVADVRSISACRDTPDGPVTERYINYYHLYWDGHRWWIAGIVWQKEGPSSPIPESWVGKFEEASR
jgi:hypothetical protein